MLNTMAITSVRWDITNRCNLSCKHCYTAVSEYQDIPYTKIVEIINKLIPLGLKEINLSGREPTMREDLFEIINWGQKKSLKVNLTTNGTTLTGSEIEKLLMTKLNMIVFSLDGASAITHDKIRSKGSFDKTLENIKHCVKLIKENDIETKIGISFTLQKLNAGECVDIINLCDHLQIDFLGINPISFCGSASCRRSDLYLSPEDISHCWEELCDSYRRIHPNWELYLGTFPMEAKFLSVKYGILLPIIYTGCSAGRTLYIDPTGRALPCYMLPPIAEEIVGLKKYLNYWNILYEPYEKAHQSFKPFIEFAESYSQKNNKDCEECLDIEVCRRCPLVALSDPDAIYRCQLARKKLDALTIKIDSKTKLVIKEYVRWELNADILSITIKKDNYLNNKKIELSPFAKDMWIATTKGISVENILIELRQKWKSISTAELQKKLNEFIDYFWKECIIGVQ